MTPAFYGDPRIQAKYVNRAEYHWRHNQIIQGEYWDGERGCAVGCLAHEDNEPHILLARATGIPVRMFHIVDKIHESIPCSTAPEWPLVFINSIPLGADLTGATEQFWKWQGNNGYNEKSADKLLELLMDAK